MSDRPVIGVVGVGNMGGAMAANLLARGWHVAVRDIEPSRVAALVAQGATAHESALSVARVAGIVIVCVVDADQSREVLFAPDGVVASPHARTVILCPTIAPQDVEQIAQELAGRAIDCIDAPMSGGPARARDGSMSLMVAASQAVFDGHADLLAALSSRLFHVSQRPGDGARTKLVNNLLAGINLAGAAEVLALAQRMGLDLQRTLDVIAQSSGQSWIGSDRMARAITGDYEPRAHMTLLAKDTRLAIEAARSAGFDGPLGERASAVFASAIKAGLAGEDDAAVFKLLAGQVPRIEP